MNTININWKFQNVLSMTQEEKDQARRELGWPVRKQSHLGE